jgi:uncharacterized membrane protein YraQ (UPF0718 family)
MTKRRSGNFEWSLALIAAFGIAAGAVIYLRDGRERFLAVLGGDVQLFVTILPQVLAGCLLGALVTLLLPRGVVTRWIGSESGLLGLFVASLAGAILPGGPFTVYPVAGALLVAGADAGAVIALITSWTLLGFTRALIWELPFFGFDFVFWRMAISLPLPVLVGLLARLAARNFPLASGGTQ